MAERRMFSKKIVKSDWFVTMPQTSQNLYWHLCMDADDDGFLCNVQQIMRMLGSTDGDLKILLAKHFLMPFDAGLMLVKHWRIHNYIQNDRYTPTSFTEARDSILLKENGVYSTTEGEQINAVSMLYPQVRLGKVSKGKVRKKRSDKEIAKTLKEFEAFWKNYPKKVGKKPVKNWWLRNFVSSKEAKKMIEAVDKYKQTDQWKKGFIPYPQTFLNQERWEDDIDTVESDATNKEFKSYSK